PHVTNSSLFMLLPSTENSPAAAWAASARSASPGAVAHVVPGAMPAAATSRSQRRAGSPNGPAEDTLRRGWAARHDSRSDLACSRVRGSAQFTHRENRYPAAWSSLAPQAESLRIAGPLSPECVTRTGPDSRRPVPRTETPAEGTQTPSRPFSRASSTWNVNRDGTGGATEWPRPAATESPADLAPPPVAIRSRSARTASPAESVTRKRPPAPAGSLDTAQTPLPVRRRAPASLADRIRQPMTVPESSVTGNILPSSSVFSSTPRSPNHATVSAGPNLWKGPISSLDPRGKLLANSPGSGHAWVMLHRPPPEIRTFESGRAVASWMVTSARGSASLHAIAAKKPAAPPPATR